MQYLSSRREGLFDWIVFHRPKRQDQQEIASRLGLDPGKPVIGLLTNVTWDAQLHYPANAFPNMLEWLVQTCEYFATRPDLQLLIRVHPAEISGFPPSRQPILAELRKRIPRLRAEHLRGAAGKRHEHLRADVAVQRRHHLRHEDGRGADERRPAGHRGGRGVDPQQGDDPRRQLAGGILPDPRRLPFPERLGAGAARAGAALRLSLLLQPDDSAAVHRAEGGLSRSTGSSSTSSGSCCPAQSPGLDTICDGILGRTPFVLRDKGAKRPSSYIVNNEGLRAQESRPQAPDSQRRSR